MGRSEPERVTEDFQANMVRPDRQVLCCHCLETFAVVDLYHDGDAPHDVCKWCHEKEWHQLVAALHEERAETKRLQAELPLLLAVLHAADAYTRAMQGPHDQGDRKKWEALEIAVAEFYDRVDEAAPRWGVSRHE